MIKRACVRLLHSYQGAREGRPSPCRFYPSCSSYALEALEVHGTGRGLWLATRRLLRCLLLRIHLLGELVRSGGQRLRLGIDRFLVVALQRFFGFLQGRFDLAFFVGGDLVAVFRQ